MPPSIPPSVALYLCRSRQEKQVKMLFVESICDDPVILERNYRMQLKNQDYKDQDPVEALKDFKVGRYIDCLKGRDGWLTE